jgi:tetratricopeptide (TPR) repeat protein
MQLLLLFLSWWTFVGSLQQEPAVKAWSINAALNRRTVPRLYAGGFHRGETSDLFDAQLNQEQLQRQFSRLPSIATAAVGASSSTLPPQATMPAGLRWSPRIMELISDTQQSSALLEASTGVAVGEADRCFRQGMALVRLGQDRAASAAFHEAATLYQCYLDTVVTASSTSGKSSSSLPRDEIVSEFAHVTALTVEECRSILAYTCAVLGDLNWDALGDPRAAVRLYQYASQIDPVPSSHTFDMLGQCFEASGSTMPIPQQQESSKTANDAVSIASTQTPDAVSSTPKSHLDLAIQSYRKAMALQPGNRNVLFHLAVALERTGNHDKEAAEILERLRRDEVAYACLVDSWGYVRWHTRRTRPLALYRGSREMLELALAHAQPRVQAGGIVAIFGVGTARSVRMTKEILPLRQTLHGFDVFDTASSDSRGRSKPPLAWSATTAGASAGALPQNLGEGSEAIQFHVGWFHETIRPFWQSQGPRAFLAYANINCARYSATLDVLEALHGRIGPGTVLVFEEYLGFPTWRFDEFRAWRECCKRFGWKYEYLAFSLRTRQAVVRITAG